MFGYLSSFLRRSRSLETSVRRYSTKQQSKPWRQKPNKEPRLKIILTEDVPKLGVKRQIVKVKHGYGRNYLLPKEIAVYATPQNIERHNAFEAEEQAVSLTSTERLVNYLEGKELIVEHHPEDQSAIFEQHISKAFQRNLKLNVPLNCIELENPITDFNAENVVGVRLDEETVVMVPVIVTRTVLLSHELKMRPMVDGTREVDEKMEMDEDIEGDRKESLHIF